jgi:type VI secretion system FHA domain protein
MALRLRIVGEQAAGLGEASTKVFGVHGGTIGRGRDNDWVLPDPERYLSGTHARVDFRAGSYVVVDTSSNGTYINDANEPLGKFHEYTLQDGDFLRLGGYEFRVSIDATNDFPPDASGIIAYDGGPPSAAVRTTTANDLGADLDLSELLETGSSIPLPEPLKPGGRAAVRNVYGQAVVAESPAAGGEGGTPWHMMTRPVRVTRDNADVEPGLAAFCRGAGIDPQQLAPEARAAALQLAGQMLRESLLGLMELQQGRAELRNRLGVSAAGADDVQSPLNLSRGSVQDILTRLLSRTSMRAGSVDALRDKFRELKGQNAATLAAMQSALTELLTRFSPAELEERFGRSARRGMPQPPGKERYWELYNELYATLAQLAPAGFPHLFAETFARDFDARMSELAPPRRGSFGSE